MNKSRLMGAVCACIITLSVTNHALANIINVDHGNCGSAVYSGQGALGSGGTPWNNACGNGGTDWTFTNLLDAGGNSTSVDANLDVILLPSTPLGEPSAGNTLSFNSLLEDYALWGTSNSSIAIKLTITDLDPLGAYNLILYGVQNALGGRGSTFDIGGNTKTTDGNITTIFSEGNTHVTYTGLTPNGSGEIVVDITKNNGDLVILNGWQLQSVPIPAAVWLFGSGLLGLVGMARRKKPA
jgi:hypothetical protein